MIDHKLTANYSIHENTMNPGINQNASESSFSQRIVKTACSTIPYILSFGSSIATGAIIAFVVADTCSNEALFEQGYGSFKCFSYNDSVMQESRKKMLTICMTTSIITSVFSPLLYMTCNAKENTDSTKTNLKNESHTKNYKC